jgi:hypothetical protein
VCMSDLGSVKVGGLALSSMVMMMQFSPQPL